jgi:hypothetical protein
MKLQKKVWKLQHQTICKVVGMAFDLKDLAKIGKKFGIPQGDPLLDHESTLHSTVVHLCGSDNKVARHMQKMIELRFARYSKRLSALDAVELVAWVTEDKGSPDIPLWAILWDLATRDLEKGSLIETALFGFLHMLEHALMKEYWDSAAERAGKHAEEERAAGEATALRRQILDLQGELERSRKLNEQLRAQVAEGKTTQQPIIGPVRIVPPTVPPNEKVARLQILLETARSEKQCLEEECSRLRKEVRVLAREVSHRMGCESPEIEEAPPRECPFREILREKHVAMVGGINSLECHYRDLVQAMGGTFQRHDGNCRGGECLIQDCVRKADLVVCPVEVNSHNAMKSVKKLCKNLGVPCCFPRTAGLSGFRTAIEEHFADSQCA